jgi:hypothetical protein
MLAVHATAATAGPDGNQPARALCGSRLAGRGKCGRALNLVAMCQMPYPDGLQGCSVVNDYSPMPAVHATAATAGPASN